MFCVCCVCHMAATRLHCMHFKSNYHENYLFASTSYVWRRFMSVQSKPIDRIQILFCIYHFKNSQTIAFSICMEKKSPVISNSNCQFIRPNQMYLYMKTGACQLHAKFITNRAIGNVFF